MKRLKLLLLLATMPQEAFSYVVVPLALRIFPDVLGGFQEASEESIKAVEEEAKFLMTQDDP